MKTTAYASYRSSLLRRRGRWKLLPGEPRVSANSSFGPFTRRTQDEVAAMLGVTRQRIQQIERNALFKLRRAMKEFR